MNMITKVWSVVACAAFVSIYAQNADIKDFRQAWNTYMASPDRMQVDEVIRIYDELRPGNKQIADERMRTDLGVTIRDLRAIQLATRGPGADANLRRQLEQALADVTAQKAALERSNQDTRALEAEIARLKELIAQGTPITPPVKPEEPTVPLTPLKPPVKPVEPVMTPKQKFEQAWTALKGASGSSIDAMGAELVTAAQGYRSQAAEADISRLRIEIVSDRDTARSMWSQFFGGKEDAIKRLGYWYQAYKILSGKTMPGVCDLLREHQSIINNFQAVCGDEKPAEEPTVPLTPLKPPVKPVEPVETPEQTLMKLYNSVQEAKGWVNGSIQSPHAELSEDVQMLDQRIAALENYVTQHAGLSLTKEQKDLFDEAKSVANANRG
jgi:polyhydroxyalkanoate synthesis regulator phasin